MNEKNEGTMKVLFSKIMNEKNEGTIFENHETKKIGSFCFAFSSILFFFYLSILQNLLSLYSEKNPITEFLESGCHKKIKNSFMKTSWVSTF